MKRISIIICCGAIMLLLQACSPKKAQPEQTETIPAQTAAQTQTQTPAPEGTPILFHELISTDDLAKYFDGYTNATMLLSDGTSQITYNEPFSTQRQSPYSTFKIANSLIILEEKVASADDSMRKWDGTQYSRSELNQDQDMASAMKYSCVWYYQQLAREVGETAMQNDLNKISYGNMDISGGIDTFWLGSSLLISPQEQLDFIIRLYHNDLPFSQSNMEYVKSIMRQEGYPIEIYGKTGSSGKGHGWFVGYAVINEKPYFFATYIESKNVDGLLARDKTAEILNDLLKHSS